VSSATAHPSKRSPRLPLGRGLSIVCLRHHIGLMLKRAAFIPPSNSARRAEPPEGDGWLHEIKFDGYRAQLHKDGDDVILLSKSGKDFTARFKGIAKAVALLPVEHAIIDAEVVASDAEGRPDFRALHSGAKEGLCAWCFDLLALDGESLVRQPLTVRRARLAPLVKKLAHENLRYSESFEDALSLLRQAAVMGLEGVVSKRADQPYVSGTNRSWVKVKTHDGREANKDRGELFEKR
jgi:bifunctional non-homologous end joining protein LigD